MNLLEMRDDLRQAIGNVSVNDVPDVTLDKCLNLAHRNIATVYPNLSSREVAATMTIVDIATYPLPTDFFALRGIWDASNNVKLTKRGERWAAQQNWLDAPKGRPTDYVRYTNIVQIWPLPDAIYQLDIYYQQNIATMVVDTDIPVLGVPWHDGLVLKARWYYYDRIRTDIPKAAASDASWKMFVQEMPSSIDLENVDIDSGVVIPSLLHGGENGYYRRDFDHGW